MPDGETVAGPLSNASFPSSLSPSRANDFLTCPLMYRLRNIDRIPEAPSAAAVRGSLVHRVLEWLFDTPAADRTLPTAQQLLVRAWDELLVREPDSAAALITDLGGAGSTQEETARVLAAADPLLAGYFALENPSRLDPHACEMAVAADVGDGLTIRGFVDRVDRTESGDVRIVDYKTGKSPRAGYEGKAMFQMRFYALTWWRMTGNVPRLLMLLYLGDRQSLTYEPESADLLATERKIHSIRQAISTAATSGVFTPKPSRLCDWCSFQHLCPTKGGLTPPMPPLPTTAIPGRPLPLINEA